MNDRLEFTCGRLVPGAAGEILAGLAAKPLLENTAEGFAPRPAYRPRTKFEARGLRLGPRVFDAVFRRCGGS
jgi:tRNA (guanine-N7-)-methyltransferase